ncbi:MAG: hypothetical protein CMP48_00410 [Rickettsiales bacterium]|nr:hypothetical protein [Rickettsiales bacterium]
MIRTLTVFILILLASNYLFAQKDTVFIRDLEASWQTIDQPGVSVPYIQKREDIVFFEIPRLETGTILKLESSAYFDIWVNDQIFFSKFKGVQFIDLDSLSNNYVESPTITCYSPDWRDGDLRTTLYQVVDSGYDTMYGKLNQPGNLDRNTYLIVAGLIFLMLGMYRRFFPGTFSKSFNSPLSFKLRGLTSDENYQAFLSFDNLYALLTLGFMASFLSYYLGYQMISLGISPNWSRSVLTIMLVALIGSGMLLAKYLWSLLISGIFQFRELPNIQNQDLTHFLMLLTSGCLIISLIDFTFYNFYSEALRSVIVMLYVIMLVFFQFWMVLKLDKIYSHRKLMIISYLCTTEFLPGFIIILWLLKS